MPSEWCDAVAIAVLAGVCCYFFLWIGRLRELMGLVGSVLKHHEEILRCLYELDRAVEKEKKEKKDD